MGIFSSLKRNQKEAIGLLQIGTFLEYFDLMLFVHMAVLLNELFFPKTDPHTAALLSAFAFCSTYVLRPFGALLFGWMGDRIGRKPTVTVTMVIMAFSCVVMANLPTYAQIGIAAAWIVTVCRMLQGLSSMGEIVTAQIYLTETIKPPLQYPVVSLMSACSGLGAMVALGSASLFTSFGFNWRIAFAFGCGIAIVGALARTRLRETPEFLEMERARQKKAEKINPMDLLQRYKSAMMFLLIECSWPICFYFTYAYCGHLLKHSFGYTPEEVIHQNFLVSIVQFSSILFVSLLSYYVYPLRILKVKLCVLSLFVLICPLWLNSIQTGYELLILQCISIMFASNAAPGIPVFLKHFPVLKRVSYSGMAHALSRMSMYIVTSFGLIYATEAFGHWGIWIAFMPTIIAFSYAVRHFERLEFSEGDEKMHMRKKAA